MKLGRLLPQALACALAVAAPHLPAIAGEPDGDPDPADRTESTIFDSLLGGGDLGDVIQWRYHKGFQASTKDDQFSLKANVRVQIRGTAEDLDSDTPKQDTVDFDAKRVRLKLAGHAFGENTKYKFQADFASKKGSGGELKDAEITQRIAGRGEMQVSGGQFKVPFSRNELTSSGKQQFVDRPLTNKEFVPGREPGVMFHGVAFGDGLLEYALMISNGEGANNKNGDNRPRYTGRLVFNPLGNPGYSESDLEREDAILPSFGVSVTNTKSKPVGLDVGETTIGIEGMVKGHGVYVAGEYIRRVRDLQGGSDDATDGGYFLEGGILPIPDVPLEFGLRFAQNHFEEVTPGVNSNGDNIDDIQEVSGVIGWFPFGHNLKIQADLTGRFTNAFSGTSTSDLTDIIARVQAQIIV